MTRPQTVTGPTRTAPEWCGDSLGPDRLMRAPAMLDASQFLAADGTKVVVSANAAQNATVVAVAPLANAIPNGTTLDFGGAKFARLTAAAALGATSLTVTALVNALVTNDTATYAGSGTLPKTVPSGTPIGRTFTERTAGTGFGPAISTDDELSFVAFGKSDVGTNADIAWLRPNAGTTIYEDRLPAGWAALDNATKALYRARFNMITTVDF